MAHAALHFTLGMAAGMAALAPRVGRAWRGEGSLADALGLWLLGAWAAGFIAIGPSLLRYAGIPPDICGGGWMNVFLFHPLLNALLPQNAIVGGAAFMGALAFQYGVVVAALLRVRRKGPASPRPAPDVNTPS
jgi:hypothetical protein